MYKIDSDKNEIQRLTQRSFSELGFRERDHLQEWIAKEPNSLGEDLLIIQKEFSGFSDTQERLDLLALDKQGSLVIIENKLDDSGRDVTWQALKYASYCSNFSKEHIKKIFQDFLDANEEGATAEEKLSEFFDDTDYDDLTLNTGVTQRIILIAARFRKEVTSTVLWLMNFKVRLQCFRATPFSMGEQLFLNFEQIIPTQDAEDYMIGMAEKAQDDVESKTVTKHRHKVRQEFWTMLLPLINERTSLYQNISPGKYHWIGAGSGVRGLGLNFGISRSYARAELYIDRDRGENDHDNMAAFEFLHARKIEIETAFGGPLVWEPLENKRACRIKAERSGNVFDQEQWNEMASFMVDSMIKLHKALQPALKDLDAWLKTER